MEERNRSLFAPRSLIVALVGLGLAGFSCKKAQTTPETSSGAGSLPARTVNLDQIPENVDGDLYRSLLRIADECKVDALAPEVRCPNASFDNLVRLFSRSPMQRHLALLTASHAFEAGDARVKVVAARLIAEAFRNPHGSVPKPNDVRKLIGQLAELPVAQAVDVCPVVTHTATTHKLEDELYAVVDGLKDTRLHVACYEPLMVQGRLRVFEKIVALAASDSLEVALAAVNAPRVMGGRTQEENQRLCDWMKDLLTDSRPLVAARAGVFLASCGPSYLDALLAADEARASQHKPLVAGLDAYGSLCAKASEHPHGKPTKAQCARLKKLAEAVVVDDRFIESERLAAMGILAQQFADRDVIALVTPLAEDEKLPRLSERAKDVLRQLGQAPARAPR